MTDPRDTPELHRLGLEPEDLDGHTIEELADYLAAKRTPPNPSIDESPGCQLALDALERLRGLTPAMFEADTAKESDVAEEWVQTILAGITLDARAGRRIPVASTLPHADLGITEGAVRGIIRSAEAAVPGVLIGRCRLDGEVTDPGVPIRIQVDASVPYGEPIPDLAMRLRSEIAMRLSMHTELNITEINVVVHDIHQLPTVVRKRQ